MSDSPDRTLVDAKSGASTARWDRFFVEGELGKGGMATVYKGRDQDTGERVALKVLTGNLDPAARVRFEREVKAAGKLSHENICRVVACGERDGQPFLAMELVEGETLAQLARRGTRHMPAAVAAALMAQLLDALGHAHAHGVLHRDLKPANVMVRPDGALKLVDFGIAKSVDDETVTKTGSLVGTPAYMAPEQVRLENVDHRVDLFAAGMTLLAMMKRNVHRFMKKRAIDPTQMLIRVALEPTPPLLTEVPQAPVSLDNVLAGLTALDPAMRFADAAAARAVLNESGLVPNDSRALLARYMADPETVGRELDAALAREEANAAETMARHKDGGAAAALALHRATLLDPDGGYGPRLEALCAQHHFTFEKIVDEKVDALRKEIYADPQSPALLKRMSDLMKARGQVRMQAAYLWRYVRERPNDDLALMQLRALLDGPADAERSSARLSTRSIVAGIKTGGFVAKARPPTLHANRRAGGVASLLRGTTDDADAGADDAGSHAADASRAGSSAEGAAPAATSTGARRAGATIVVAKSTEVDAGSGRISARTVAAVVVAVIVIGAATLLITGVKDAIDAITGKKSDHAALTVPEELAAAEHQLVLDPVEAAAAASRVLNGHPTPNEGLLALWIRARAYAQMKQPDDARHDCDLYLAKATDFHDPHLMDVKALLASLAAP